MRKEPWRTTTFPPGRAPLPVLTEIPNTGRDGEAPGRGNVPDRLRSVSLRPIHRNVRKSNATVLLLKPTGPPLLSLELTVYPVVLPKILLVITKTTIGDVCRPQGRASPVQFGTLDCHMPPVQEALTRAVVMTLTAETREENTDVE